jgi:hypothetical protein
MTKTQQKSESTEQLINIVHQESHQGDDEKRTKNKDLGVVIWRAQTEGDLANNLSRMSALKD